MRLPLDKTTVSAALCEGTLEGEDEVVDGFLGDQVVPGMDDLSSKFFNAVSGRVVCTDHFVQVSPQHFDGIEFRRVRRPVVDVDAALATDVVEALLSDVAASAVLHEDVAETGAVTNDT